MLPLLSPEEMAAADRAAIDSGTPVEVLMDRAGRAVAAAAVRLAGARYGRRAAVVSGKGNNGGDGLVAARVLAREGMAVRTLFVGDLDAVRGAARVHLERLRAGGGRVEAFRAERLAGADVVVDALFGTGFKGEAEGSAKEAIDAMNASGAPVVAVDIPSGVDGATGRAAGPVVRATVTVAMAALKTGTAVGDGAARAGAVEVADIGIAIDGSKTWLLEPDDVAGVLPVRPPDAHKRSVGSVAILAGSDGMSGAALLTARGAVRAGAGYATLGVTAAVARIASAVLPEVLTTVVADGRALERYSLERFGPVVKRADAVAIGPGLGQGDEQLGLVSSVLGEVDAPVVVDADGLNVLAGHTEVLARRSAPSVLTPHPAELGRLLGRSTGDVQADRVSAAREAATGFGCVVVLKGFHSIVAGPDGSVFVVPTGGPELATAGTGDVLTGVVAAFLARGMTDVEAAWAAAFVHGLAGAAAARRGGAGVLAWDVAEALPEALRSLGHD